ncbi:A24 family peptidase [Schinkia azotoformans]|uniref:A24 family peptidase n=1 Tax=Schinkia azotoformans TaxID=1454 RepID=UPI002E1FEAB4|nr:A24 family peptidase [Schinkia azotoformans]
MLDLIIILFGFSVLLVATIKDFKSKTIPNWLTLGSILCLVLYRLFEGNFFQYFTAFAYVGITFTLLSWLTKEAIGGGDIKLFLALSLICGLQNVFLVIVMSFVMAFLVSITVCKKEVELILAPFILVSYTILTILERWVAV